MFRHHLERRRTSQAGAAAVIMAVFIAALMIPLGAIGVDIARWYVEAERVQAAADAAATAGVTYMPDDFDSARARAFEIAEDNGFRHGSNATVTVARGSKPTQLRVTVSSPVTNQFGRMIGIGSTSMSRSAMADYNGPAPMGSPCNTFANEPPGTTGLGPVASALKTPPFAQCSNRPDFWAAISGPDVDKNQGSQFETRYCGGGEDGCVGGANDDFDPRGYIYLVRVNPAAVGTPIQLQVYDPAYVSTGLRCTSEPTSGPGTLTSPRNSSTSAWWPTGWNPYAPDSYPRYWRTGQTWNGYSNGATPNTPNAFCSGDDPNTSLHAGTTAATVTSFGLRAPVDTLDPFQGPPVPGCVRQYRGYNATEVSVQTLRDGDTNYNPEIAKVFRQWVRLCSFTPTQAGDYYLQVRTNVALGGTDDGAGGRQGNMNVYNQTGDNTAVRGTGTNMFALRAVSGAPAGAVSVAAYERMRIFANADAATTTFNLVRVVPAAANKTLLMSFFDVGEGSSSGSVKIIPPADSNLPANVAGCVGAGVRNGALSNCTVPNITPASFNGKLQTIRIPIPSTYECQVAGQGGCWWRVQVNFGSGTVTDATTWTAKIVGEPVRLVE